MIKLDSYKFIRSGGRKGVPRLASYPWDEWTKGDIIQAIRHEDFDCSTVNFRAQLFTRASRMTGLKVRTSILGGSVVFQFYKPKG